MGASRLLLRLVFLAFLVQCVVNLTLPKHANSIRTKRSLRNFNVFHWSNNNQNNNSQNNNKKEIALKHSKELFIPQDINNTVENQMKLESIKRIVNMIQQNKKFSYLKDFFSTRNFWTQKLKTNSTFYSISSI